ncbi:MAG: PTS sugar transporter subunit IIA [Anaerolineaceae bacterium]|nr:PTS sugar transporter subunit IIA [Anaerolineaceae bacterium]
MTLPFESNEHIQLADILKLETVRAKIKVDSWQHAAAEVGRLLVEAGMVEEQYVEKMKQVLEELGPYVVIAPGVALLHARPEDGVLHPCIGLLTLMDAVNFGHSENDPVDIVLAFGATDKNSHINALKQMAERLGDPEAVTRIRSAKSDEALHEAFIARRVMYP